MIKSIHYAVYADKLNERERKELSDEKYISSGAILSVGNDRYDIASGCDRSDIA